MQDRGAEPKIFALQTRDWDFERVAFEETSRLLKAAAFPASTILCANDRIAFGVMAAIWESGAAIGRLSGVRVAGHDDHPLSQYTCPPLTTVAQDVERLATVSLERLMQAISEGANADESHKLEAKLIMRSSA